MKTFRTAVIGVGVQGERHAQKLAALDESDLVGVVDADTERAKAVAADLGTEAVADYRDLIGKVDAVVIATPTITHFEITAAMLENDIDVLLEKPFTTTMEEAIKLVEMAESRSRVLQVGHLERYNPAILALADRIERPQFIESNRIAPYKPRSLDVSVVLDLMIHDIDLIHSFVRSPMSSVDAVGRSIFSDSIDVANARIRFENGCVANVTSSRTSTKTERSMRIFQDDAYASADLHNKTVAAYSKLVDGPVTGPEDVKIDKQSFGDSDALLDQARAFLASVAGGPPPLVSGRTAMEALNTAEEISRLVAAENKQ